MKYLKRNLLSVLLPALLLFAQAGEYTHALSHLTPTQAQKDKQSPQHDNCEQCVSYAQMGGALGATATVPPLLQSVAFHFNVAIIASLAVDHNSPAARAPPALLTTI